MSLVKASSKRLRALTGKIPFKVPVGLVAHSPRAKAIIAALTLVFFWIIGPHTFQQHGAAGEGGAVIVIDPTVEGLNGALAVDSRPSSSSAAGTGATGLTASSDPVVLNLDEAEKFCLHFHLTPYNASAAAEGSSSSLSSSSSTSPHRAPPRPPRQRRIYDLLVVTSETSADLLEFRLASMYQHIDYFIILETPSPAKAEDSGSSDPSAPPPSIDPPTLLDRIWTSRLSSYHAKIIRHTLSQHAYDFKHGLDHAATTRNAIFTRVIPLLTGAQKVQLGDVLLISDVEEVLRPVTTRVLRNCDIPERTTVRTRRYWYSYQWMKIDGLGAKPDPLLVDPEEALPPLPEHPDPALQSNGHRKKKNKKSEKGNEWWPHPQATVYQGADTILPDDLRKQRSLDEYVFGDGGWTCHLCYPTISETLVKLGEGGVIWHDGPRWKAAGRVVSKVMKGIDLYDRTHLARIEVNPDLPPYLQNNPHRYKWLLDRDPLGANFADFEPTDLDRYFARKKTVDAEPDFERTKPDLDYVLENIQEESRTSPPLPGPAPAWRDGGGPLNFVVHENVDLGETPELSDEDQDYLAQIRGAATRLTPEDIGALQLSEEDKKFLEEIRGKDTALGPDAIKMLESLTRDSTM